MKDKYTYQEYSKNPITTEDIVMAKKGRRANGLALLVSLVSFFFFFILFCYLCPIQGLNLLESVPVIIFSAFLAQVFASQVYKFTKARKMDVTINSITFDLHDIDNLTLCEEDFQSDSIGVLGKVLLENINKQNRYPLKFERELMVDFAHWTH